MAVLWPSPPRHPPHRTVIHCLSTRPCWPSRPSMHPPGHLLHHRQSSSPAALAAAPAAATESSVLACLWTLEALHSAWRSSATACLGSYVKLLAAFSPEVRGSCVVCEWRGQLPWCVGGARLCERCTPAPRLPAAACTSRVGLPQPPSIRTDQLLLGRLIPDPRCMPMLCSWCAA